MSESESIARKFTEEENDRIFAQVRAWQEEGCSGPNLEPSLLGLDWSDFFSTRDFQHKTRSIDFLNPPEFIEYGFTSLDCYATAVLASGVEFKNKDLLTFECALKQRKPGDDTQLEFRTVASQKPVQSDMNIMRALLTSFPAALRVKNIEPPMIFFLESEGCVMNFAYPGRMLATKSPFLNRRPVELWPVACLKIEFGPEILDRAENIVSFLLNDPPTDGKSV